MKNLTFGERLTNFRKLRNISQEGLAELCGVSLATISRWETNDMRPRPQNLERLSEVLHVDVASFFDSSEHILPESMLEQEFISLIESLSSDEQVFFLRFLQDFIKLRHFSSPDDDSV